MMIIKSITLIALVILSLFCALFLGAWGPPPFYLEYIPHTTTTISSFISQLIWMAILYSPVIYLLFLAYKKVR